MLTDGERGCFEAFGGCNCWDGRMRGEARAMLDRSYGFWSGERRFRFVYGVCTIGKEKERVRSDRENPGISQVAVRIGPDISRLYGNFLTRCAELVDLMTTRIHSRTSQTVQILPHLRKLALSGHTHAQNHPPSLERRHFHCVLTTLRRKRPERPPRRLIPIVN